MNQNNCLILLFLTLIGLLLQVNCDQLPDNHMSNLTSVDRISHLSGNCQSLNTSWQFKFNGTRVKTTTSQNYLLMHHPNSTSDLFMKLTYQGKDGKNSITMTYNKNHCETTLLNWDDYEIGITFEFKCFDNLLNCSFVNPKKTKVVLEQSRTNESAEG